MKVRGPAYINLWHKNLFGEKNRRRENTAGGDALLSVWVDDGGDKFQCVEGNNLCEK